MTKPSSWSDLRAQWASLAHYQRFEGLVALALTFVIGLVILVALFRLVFGVVTGLLLGVLTRWTIVRFSPYSARYSPC